MADYHNPYMRLQIYYSLLACPDVDINGRPISDMSIAQIHDDTEIPLPIIRKDIMLLLQWEGTLSPDDASKPCRKANAVHSFMKLYRQITDSHFPKELEALFLSGCLDDVPFFMKNASSAYQLGLTPDEAIALQSSYPSALPDREGADREGAGREGAGREGAGREGAGREGAGREGAGREGTVGESRFSTFYQKLNFQKEYEIKDSYRYYHYNKYRPQVDGAPSSMNDMLDTINDAIRNEKSLIIQYRSSEQRRSALPIAINPLKIAYDSFENQYAVITTEGGRVKAYYLDCILSAKRGGRQTEAPDYSLLKNRSKVWGFDFNAKPQQVKVRFSREANVWAKVRKDLAYRDHPPYEKDGYLYYEDLVCGIEKFKLWLYGYGSSAVVIAPLSLRKEIIASLEKRRDRF